MSDVLIAVFFVLAAYFLGSVPFGLLAGFAAKKIDIREHGSKNIGATNVFRVVGKKWGIAVLALDALKGYIACVLPSFFGQTTATPFQLLLGVSVIMGHSFPVWLKFKGGKGVATSLGVFLAVIWIPTLITFGIWILCFTFTRIISISSLVAAAVFPAMVAVFYRGTPDLMFLLPLSIALACFIFYTHRANIQRLREGTEKKLF
ncbi:MAG TPA: glycerol-3-phosphate 1-O-acyltransferase PlsY [Candidatus Omnitrophota bacterium]|nr:glycerol-3-phosphate 1-O-acyltransferase PlsY [Candidatus Omnitrophota bacterium]HRY85215.1 glycerol-3-phosphate 1-O-acyltransferase PlsY [Candidatus Omnitrophota bacterium]